MHYTPTYTKAERRAKKAKEYLLIALCIIGFFALMSLAGGTYPY